jgi:hypothetical protein
MLDSLETMGAGSTSGVAFHCLEASALMCAVGADSSEERKRAQVDRICSWRRRRRPFEELGRWRRSSAKRRLLEFRVPPERFTPEEL